MSEVSIIELMDLNEQQAVASPIKPVVMLPCPLCGSSDLWVGYNSPSRVVRCECGVQFDNNSNTDEDVIAAWNERASQHR